MSFVGILSIIFAFGLLVLIHELGHFLAAKWMGVRVDKFSIGFPPKIFSKKIGETEFSISAIPLGGYVKMAGFIDESMDSKITGADYEYNSKPVWKRMIIITAGVIMNLLLAIVIYTFLSYSQGETKNPTTIIKITGESGIAKKIGLQDGDEILAINNNKVEYWDQVGINFFENLGNDIHFKIERGEEIVDLTYKKEWLSGEKGELLDIEPVIPAVVGETVADMPASEIGLQRGDVITELNNIPVNSWQEMTETIRNSAETAIPIKWKPGERLFESTITPKKIHAEDEQGKDISFGQIGVGYNYIQTPVSFLKAVKNGIVQPFQIIYLNIMGLKWVFSGVKSAEESFAGPGTIAKMVSDAADRGWVYYLNMLGILNSVLAFFNILPIPALDGGHFAFLLIEGIMRKPLSVKTRLIIQQLGMAILLSLIVFILYIDFNRLFF
jgi:regulator of sigma E protease